MRKRILLPLALWVCTAVSFAKEAKVNIVFKTAISQAYKDTITHVIRDYQAKYHALASTIAICDTNIAFVKEGTDFVGCGAMGEHDKIIVNLAAIKDRRFTAIDFRNAIAHELFHTLQPKKKRKVAEFVLLDRKTVIDGFLGLNYCVKGTGDVRMRTMEEAAAEALAYFLYKDYSTSDPAYHAIGAFVVKMLNEKWITPADLIRASKENNPNAIIACIVGTTEAKLSLLEIGSILNSFSGVYQTFEWQSRFQKIKEYRKKKNNK